MPHEPKTIYWLRIISTIGLIIGIFLSLKLWIGSHLFPSFPLFQNLPFIVESLQFELGIFLIILLAASLFLKEQKKVTLGVVVLSALFIIYDQNRLQPWVYQYIISLIILNLFQNLSAFRIYFSSIYIWSGLQKINIVFMASIFPWMLQPILAHLPVYTHQYILLLGIIAPFIEVLIGLGLMTQKFKKFAGITGIIMHVGILLVLGPWGHNWNSIVWPWNVVMIGIIIILMFDKTHLIFPARNNWKKFIPVGILLIITCIFPALNFINKWDSYLSSSLYSGTPSTATITINSQPYDYLNTSISELNVPLYPEPRIYKQLTKTLCEQNPISDIRTTITERKSIFKRSAKTDYYSCNNFK